MPVRPTTDIAKEGLFNILNNRIDFENLTVLELFAGTGSISYEFASRGAGEITVVEINPRCAEFIRKTADDMGFPKIRVVKANAFGFLGFCKARYDLIFADPPYEMKDITTIPELIFNNSLLNPGGIFILEHSRDHVFSGHPAFIGQRKYGKVNFSFFKL